MSKKLIFIEKKYLIHPSKILYNAYIFLNCIIGVSLIKSGFHREIQVVENF